MHDGAGLLAGRPDTACKRTQTDNEIAGWSIARKAAGATLAAQIVRQHPIMKHRGARSGKICGLNEIEGGPVISYEPGAPQIVHIPCHWVQMWEDIRLREAAPRRAR